MSIPDDIPPASDLYYVALSIFDGAESYDQVGFANDNGSWQIYYSTSPVCDSRPATHWNASALNRNTTYRFEISVEAGGVVVFAALEATGGILWQESVHTGATYLQVESTQTCGTTTVSGLTEMEEVYAAVLGNPPYNFALANASEDGLTESDWANLPGSSNTTVIEHSGSNATIFNEPFTLRFAGGLDAVTIETASSPQVLRSTVSVAWSTPGAIVGVSAFTSAAAWDFSASPSSSNSSFVSVLTIEIPAGISTGVYTVEIEASNAAGLSNRVGLVITALPGLTPSSHPIPPPDSSTPTRPRRSGPTRREGRRGTVPLGRPSPSSVPWPPRSSRRVTSRPPAPIPSWPAWAMRWGTCCSTTSPFTPFRIRCSPPRARRSRWSSPTSSRSRS